MKKKVHKETEMVKAVKELESGLSADVVAREHGISIMEISQAKKGDVISPKNFFPKVPSQKSYR